MKWSTYIKLRRRKRGILKKNITFVSPNGTVRKRTKLYINSGAAMQQETIIREVSEIGFSPYLIFRDIIKKEYNHVYSVHFQDLKQDEVKKLISKHLDLSTFVNKSYSTFGKETSSNETFYYSVDRAIFISINNVGDKETTVVIMVNDASDVKELIDDMKASKKPSSTPKISIICYDRGFYSEQYDIKSSENENITLLECYNKDFEEVAAAINRKLNVENGKGIVLLHGDFGTGKTTFMRSLITTNKNKKVIYLPPDLADKISSPEFVTFLMNNPNSILIIEDGENILRAREAGGSQAVSNLLNVSDGILGDVLHIQIVCTFNSSLDEIDKALLRPGRLIAEYKFEKLEVDRANALLRKLYGEEVVLTEEPMSLADIFNADEKQYKTVAKKKVKFGFV